MANDQTLATVLSSLSMGMYGLSYLVAFIYALTQLGRYPKAAKLLLIGVSIWLASFVLSMLSNIIIPQFFNGTDNNFLYVMTWNLFRTCLHAIGLCFVVYAAFTNRKSFRDTHPQDEFLSSEQVGAGPASGNPFDSPKSR